MVRRKVACIIFVLAAIVLNIFYIDYQFFFILILTVAIPLISWILFGLSKIKLSVRLKTDSNIVTVDDSINLYINARNACRVYISNGRLKLVSTFSNRTEEKQYDINVNVYGDKTRNKLKIVPKHAGIMHITVGRMDIYDYLRVFHSVREFKGVRDIQVLPKKLEVNRTYVYGEKSQLLEEDYVPERIGNGTEIRDFRYYMEGDSEKNIHWKLSASNAEQEYIVMQHEDDENRFNAILVDLNINNVKNEKTDTLDKIYQCVYSIAWDFVKNGEKAIIMVWDDRNESIKYWEFNNEYDLIDAMGKFMNIETHTLPSEKFMEKVMYGENMYLGKLIIPIYVTTKDYETDMFRVINATGEYWKA
ncbi:MAG: DUF58 domain-containing protein [Eubacteriales bacterium]|nr:DUF58 domain-containing protein [Eubacteriales bacterium]